MYMPLSTLTTAEKRALISRGIERQKSFPKLEGETNAQHITRYMAALLARYKKSRLDELLGSQYRFENPDTADTSDV